MLTKKRAFLTTTAALAASLMLGTAGAADLVTTAKTGATADLTSRQVEQPTQDFVISPAQSMGAQATAIHPIALTSPTRRTSLIVPTFRAPEARPPTRIRDGG